MHNAGTIQVKDVVPADVYQWDFDISGPTNNTATLGSGGSSSSFTSIAGSYTVTETGYTGTVASNYNSAYKCVNGLTTITEGTGSSASFNLVQSQNIVCTFTNTIKNATVTVTKFQDDNADGIKGSEEPGLSGWTINLTNGSTLEAITGTNGVATFENNVLPGSYTIEEDITGD
jgi:hypothetical protein